MFRILIGPELNLSTIFYINVNQPLCVLPPVNKTQLLRNSIIWEF
jgi:hypothetical protein